MTLVIGLLATDGLVIASDSQMSMGPTSRPGQKVHISDDGAFSFGLSGEESSMQRLRAALAALELRETVEDVQEQLQAVASRALTPQFDAVRNVAGGLVPPDQLPVAEAIVGPIQIATVRLVEGRALAERVSDYRALQDAVNSWVRLEAERFRQHQPGG